MATLIFSNANGVNVTYKTDLLKGNSGLFTVMTTEGLSEAEIEHGLDFRSLPYDLAAFKTFAQAHNLKLTRVDADDTETTYDYTDESDSGSIII
ncbi:MAG TPA: hypothetical protein PLE28_03645 [bacterium]|jgi:hypothetical protein|nr:hypothetical protein [bacterium]